MAPANDDDSTTAQSHAPTTPPLTDALSDAKALVDGSADAAPAEEAPAEAPAEDGGLDPTLKKKKKKKVVLEDADGTTATPGAGADDTGLDLSLKKKKKAKKETTDEDDFTAKLKELNLEGKEGEEGAEEGDETGDMVKGTGIWAHDETKPISFDLLLTRFFYQLSLKNPDHALGGTKSKIPPPQCMREGNKKTIFANLSEICKRMKRDELHVIQYLFTELGTSGSVDGSQRLVIKGKFQQKQIENIIRKYIIEYVSCKTCKSGDTVLSKGENRLNFVTCNSCGSRRSVQSIKLGFKAQVGRRKKTG